jgi:hypothetical protein
MRSRTGLLLATLLLALPRSAHAGSTDTIDAKSWQLLKRESGPVNYYAVETDGDRSYVHARYVPGLKTAVVGYTIPTADRRRIRKVGWSWRAVTLPNGGDECTKNKEDSAAVVYLTWRRGLRYYSLKYVWSAVGQKGRVCDSKRNPFVAQDTIILQSGGPTGTWRTEEIDLASEFRRHFENNDPNAEVPDFVGIGLMSDGDQTNSESSADYGTFTLTR